MNWHGLKMPPLLREHFFMISYMVWHKQINVLCKETTELIGSTHAPPSFVGGRLSFMGLIPPMSMTPLSQSFVKPSFSKFESSRICLGYANMVGNPPQLDPYHVPQYSMTSSWVTFVTIKIIIIWCLQRFPLMAHSHVQDAYSVNGCITLYDTWE